MELLRALALLAEPPHESHRAVREALGIVEPPDAVGHTDLFAFQLVPYASPFLNADGMLGGDVRDRVAGFRQALGYGAVTEPDSLSDLLALYASVAERARDQADPARKLMLEQARAALAWEHLAPWVFMYADKARTIAAPFYRAWAALLFDALAVALAQDAAASELPVHLRSLPAMPEPQDADADGFLGALLSPARSGLLLTRYDLRRAAADVGLGLRQGERRYILRALLGQDADATLAWLAREATAQARRYGELAEIPPAIGAFWAGRALRTAELLRATQRVTA